MDHLGAALALGLGLARDRANHRLVDVDVLDLDVRHLDAPRIGLLVEHFLDVAVQLLALGEEFVQLVLTEDRAQRGLRELAGRLIEVRHLDDGELRVDHPKINHGVHLHGHVVARDHVLRRHVEDARAQIHAHHLLDRRHDDDQARPHHAVEAPEEEHHAALVLAQDLDRRDRDHKQQEQHADGEIHFSLPLVPRRARARASR